MLDYLRIVLIPQTGTFSHSDCRICLLKFREANLWNFLVFPPFQHRPQPAEAALVITAGSKVLELQQPNKPMISDKCKESKSPHLTIWINGVKICKDNTVPIIFTTNPSTVQRLPGMETRSQMTCPGSLDGSHEAVMHRLIHLTIRWIAWLVGWLVGWCYRQPCTSS